MKKEPETVQCPKAKVRECLGKCSHAEPHKKGVNGRNCDGLCGCPACEPVRPENVVALLKSIAHWDLIAQGLELSRGSENCECCKQFYGATSCSDCLIAANGHSKCENTPYMKICSWCLTKNQTPEALDAIEAEIEFLISCLPEAEQKAFSLENVQPFLRFGDKVWLGEEQVGFIDYPTSAPRCRIMHLGSGRFENVALSELSLFPPKPKTKTQLWETLQVGQPIVVWDNDKNQKRVKFFLCYQENVFPIRTCELGAIKETDFYKNFRLPTRAEAQKLGFDLNRWQWADDETQKGETK